MANINKNIIMQAGAAVANAANKAAGLSAATPEPGSIISVIQLVNGGRTIGPDALAHFTESVRNKLLSLLVSMEPIQDFNGYGHPWPAGGGVNKFPEFTDGTQTDITLTNNNGELTLNGTAGASRFFEVSVNLSAGSYAISLFNPSATDNESDIIVYVSRTDQGAYEINPSTANKTGTFSVTTGITKIRIRVSSGAVLNNFKLSPMLVEGSTAPTTFSPYSNICPISGRTGLHVYAGPTSAIGDAATYSMDWTSPAGTVYAGSADIVSGDIKAAPYYASYNGETLVGPWVSSMDVYDPEGTPTTGAQVVDLGGAMTEYHITGQDIITLVGDNYIWSDSGDVTITE